MTIKELIDVLTSHSKNGYEGAQVYIEFQLADQIYIQKPIEHIRIESGAYNNICIIAGINGDQSIS